MHSDPFQLPGADAPVWVQGWLPDAPPRAALLIVHGLAEHGGRYARLAGAMTAAGIAVYAPDLPGHGRSVARTAALGHVEGDGWRATLDLLAVARAAIGRRHPRRPLFMLGHSRGSFLLQEHLLEQGEGLAGAVLSASCADMGPLRPIGLALIRAEARLLGGAHRSALGEALAFKGFNRRFAPTRTAFDWLSRDAAEVDRYIADPLCGFRVSAATWVELLAAGGRLRDPARLARLPPTLPLLLQNGGADPACRFEAGAIGLERMYRDAGLRDVTRLTYAAARHELLNETCRDAVTADLRHWLEQRLAGR